MQNLLVSALILWAAWLTFGFLLPNTRRRARGRLARWSEGRLPSRVTAWLRPGFPTTNCGCDTVCHETSKKSEPD